MRFFPTALVLVLATCALSGCGGGSRLVTLPNTARALLPNGSLTNARVVIHIPARQTLAAAARNPQYISAATHSVTIGVDSSTPTVQNLTPTSPNCSTGGGELTCIVSIVATISAHVFTFKTYDQINAGGAALSVNSLSQTLVANSLNDVNITLAGIPTALSITAVPSPSIVGSSASGFQFVSAMTQTLVVNALDADGNIMLGPGAPVLAANATSVQAGSAIVVNPVAGNPNEFTVGSSGLGSATFSASATPTSALAGAPIVAAAALSSTTLTTTLAGKLNQSGFVDGTNSGALFNSPSSVTYDPLTSDLYVADSSNFVIRQTTIAGVVTTIAGAGTPGFADGTGASAKFSGGQVGITYAANTATLYVDDWNNCAIRALTPAGAVTTIAGAFPPGGPVCGYLDGNGTNARVSGSNGITYDSNNGSLYITDANCAIRQVSTSGTVTTIAGAYPVATCGSVDGIGTAARFGNVKGIAYDSSDGALYVIDASYCTIRRVTTLGVVTTFAGSTGSCTLTDGTGIAAGFSGPVAITYDADNGNLYVGDLCAIRQVTPAGVVTTVAGSGSCFASVDGIGTNAAFPNAPFGLAVVPGIRNLYVADYFGDALRQIQL